MSQSEIITGSEYNKLCEYTDLTDVIITYKNGVFKISTPQENTYYTNKSKLMRYVNENLFYIHDALKELYHDRETDGKRSDF
jgi:hypothetical protein